MASAVKMPLSASYFGEFDASSIGVLDDFTSRSFAIAANISDYANQPIPPYADSRGGYGSQPQRNNTVCDPDTPCRFSSTVLDECHASRFYARTMEYYLLEIGHQVSAYTNCPMSDCNRYFSNVKDMLWHLKDCAYIGRGKFNCPCCNRTEKFRTVSKKKCAWDRTNFSMKIQKSLRASAKFLGMLRTKPTECPNCHHSLSNEQSQDTPVCYDDTPYNPTEFEFVGDQPFTAVKPSIHQAKPNSFGLSFSSQIYPDIQEFPDNSVIELANTSPRPELANTGLSPVDRLDQQPQFSCSSAASSNPSSFSKPFDNSPEIVSPPSTVQGSSASVISPASAGKSSLRSSHSKMRRLSSRIRRYGQDPSSNKNVPISRHKSHQTSTTGSEPFHRSYGSYFESPVSGLNDAQSFRAEDHSGFPIPRPVTPERPVSLTIITDLGELYRSPWDNTNANATAHTRPKDLNIYNNSTDKILGQQPTSLPQESPQSSRSNDTCDTLVGEESEEEWACPEPGCPYKPSGKEENFSAYLSKHLKIHNRKMVDCPVCGNEFTRHDNMTHHLGKAHPEFTMAKKRPVSHDDLQRGVRHKRPLYSA